MVGIPSDPFAPMTTYALGEGNHMKHKQFIDQLTNMRTRLAAVILALAAATPLLSQTVETPVMPIQTTGGVLAVNNFAFGRQALAGLALRQASAPGARRRAPPHRRH